MIERHASAAVLAGAVAAGAFLVANRAILSAPYDWDEVDYVDAARLGAGANLLERGSLRPTEFARFVMSKARGAAFALPPGYDENADPLIRRHYHPPGVVTALALTPEGAPEWVARIVQVAGAAALIAVMLGAYVHMAPAATSAGIVLTALCAAWAASLAFVSISFHGWAAVWTVLAAAAVGWWLRSPTLRASSAAGGALGCAALTLETAVFVAVVLGALMFTAGPVTRAERVRALARVLLIALAIVVVVWPGALIHASLVKIPTLYLYRLWLGDEYADVRHRLAHTAIVLAPAILAILVVFLAGARRVLRVPIVALFVTGLAYGILLLPLALTPVYLTAGAAAVCVVGAAAVSTLGTSRQWGAVAMFVLLIGLSWLQLQPERRVRLRREDVQHLASLLKGRPAYVDGAHIYRFYLGQDVPIQALTVSPDGMAMTKREDGAYRALRPDELNGSVVCVQKGRLPASRVPPAVSGCRDLGETQTLRVFDCGA